MKILCQHKKYHIKDIEEEANKTEKRGKKDNKFIGFIKKHKGLSMFIGLILLFAISLGGNYFIFENN